MVLLGAVQFPVVASYTNQPTNRRLLFSRSLDVPSKKIDFVWAMCHGWRLQRNVHLIQFCHLSYISVINAQSDYCSFLFHYYVPPSLFNPYKENITQKQTETWLLGETGKKIKKIELTVRFGISFKISCFRLFETGMLAYAHFFRQNLNPVS